MADATLSGGEQSEQAGEQEEEEEADDAPPAPATGAADDDDDDDEDAEDNNPGGRRRRRGGDTLLALFGPAAPLVKYVVDNVKIEMAATCGFPEHVMSAENPNTPLLDIWIARLWAAANDKYRSGQLHLVLVDRYVKYVRQQLAPIRNGVKKWAEPIVEIVYHLDRADPNIVRKARDLVEDEKWLSPKLANDDGIFKHKTIRDVIKFSFFRSSRSLGSKNRARFVPLVPLETIAYACAIIRHLIGAYQSSDEKASDLNSSENADHFRNYMRMLKEIGEEDPTALVNIRLGITLAYLKSRPQLRATPVVKLNLGPAQELDEDAVREIQDILGDDIPDPEEWAVVSRKGKGRAGPSQLRQSTR
ncbi:hypothetical protein FS749_013450 [Ceratobasidium sp. UAMH 11750]|nr:hypothetical protein FS749_013450 [Ceratobasidium sp. UAMH 11750]